MSPNAVTCRRPSPNLQDIAQVIGTAFAGGRQFSDLLGYDLVDSITLAFVIQVYNRLVMGSDKHGRDFFVECPSWVEFAPVPAPARERAMINVPVCPGPDQGNRLETKCG